MDKTLKVARERNYDRFVSDWWLRKFRTGKRPTWDSAITCADATDLLRAFEKRLRAELERVK